MGNMIAPPAHAVLGCAMTSKQFYDWQTAGGAGDVMRLIQVLEQADVTWCVIGGIAVNYWATQPMVTQDVDIVIAVDAVERIVSALTGEGFRAERFEWSINLQGKSSVSIQISTEHFYRDFPQRSVAADVHGILMRVASLEDTLGGKLRAWSDPKRRQSKRIKDLADIARLLESHPQLADHVPPDVKTRLAEW